MVAKDAAILNPIEALPGDSPEHEEHGLRGWLAHRKEEHEREDARDAQYRAALARLRGGDDSPEMLAELRGLADRRSKTMAREALTAYSERLLVDDVLSHDEETHWEEVCDALGCTSELAEPEFRALTARIWIAEINDGRLPELAPGQSHLLLKRGETVHLETGAALVKEVVDREFRGGSQGLSIPLGHGLRYRTSAFRGKSVVVGSHLAVVDEGPIVVSSSRIVFMGARRTMETPYSKLAGVDMFSDGVRIHASNRQTAQLFKVGIGGEVIAATIQAAAQRAM